MSSSPIQNELPAHAATSPEGDASAKDGKPGAKRIRRPWRMGAEKRVQIVAFFANNPGDDLTIEDASVKFSIALSTAGGYLAQLAGEGVLERVSIYRLKAKE